MCCSLEEVVAGAWQVQEALECLADAADNPKGLDRGLATMSAVAQHRSKLQVHTCPLTPISLDVDYNCVYIAIQLASSWQMEPVWQHQQEAA